MTRCPRCWSRTKVVDSRDEANGLVRYRRRECDDCGWFGLTYETLQAPDQKMIERLARYVEAIRK